MRPDPAAVGMLDDGTATAVAHEEQLTVGSQWALSGRLRLRREVRVETRTIEVQVRREVLTVDFEDLEAGDPADPADPAGADGAGTSEPPLDRAPMTILLREEVPSVSVVVTPYEQVTARVSRVTADRAVGATLSREHIVFEATAGVEAHGDR